jgi:2',3'-cyclic-nucleotide 2'-phosphodiesterase (5'-nucleotidase family)
MMHAKTATYIICAVVLFISSCEKSLFPSDKQVTYHYITDTIPQDSISVRFIAPYRDSLSKSMNKIIGTVGMDMPKEKPESLMGNFFCDALREQGTLYFYQPIDVCIMNYGGLRIPLLPKGEVTVGKIYELMPFDNFLVLMKVKGNVLQQLLNHIANEGGWPVSGIKMKTKNATAYEMMINNEPLQQDKVYSLLVSDYMADGGDKLEMLKGTSYDNSGVFVRDALISYIIQKDLTGETIQSKIEGRIKYAE